MEDIAGFLVHMNKYSFVWRSPQLHLSSSSFLNLHFTIFVFVLATHTLILLMVFHRFHDKFLPGGRYWVDWIGSSDSVSFFHICYLAWCGKFFSFVTEWIKLCQDLGLVLWVSYSNMGCLSLFNYFVFSRSVAMLYLISDGAMPDRQYILFIGVGRRHSVLIRYLISI